jgi:hypothetical protein
MGAKLRSGPDNENPLPLRATIALVADLGDEAAWRYVEFFTANIRNPNTRRAYLRAFLGWCEDRGLALAAIRPHNVRPI